MKRYLSISIILPTYNEEKNLPNCLESIKAQVYPKDKIELFVIDDNSTDKTIAVARKYKAKIIFNGSHNCEIGRSLGLKAAKGELVLIIDADNILPESNWIKKFCQVFLENPGLVGAQSGWYVWQPKDSIINRYCALFGASKPLSFYLRKRNFLMATETNWPYPQSLVANKTGYFLVRFTPENMPTLGSQGFVGLRKLLIKTKMNPYYYHMDSLYDLIKGGHNLFAVVKLGIIHHHTETLVGFHKKFFRDAYRFFKQKGQRRYVYQTSLWEKLRAVLIMVTLVVPLFDSFRGYRKKKDLAWFLHPLVCQTTAWLTLIAFVCSL